MKYVTERQTDSQILHLKNISADEMYSTICVGWAGDHFGLD